MDYIVPSLPFTNPVLIFFIVLTIILLAPLLLNRLGIPHIIGLIIAGMVVGPNGTGLLLRDSSFEIFGQVGLLYLMFLAGLEMDINDFKKNKSKGIGFGIYTFLVPMILGTVVTYYTLGYNLTNSLLLASMYASHTLVAYPLLSRYGVAKSQSVTMTIAGTIITVLGALIILAVITGTAKGELDHLFWIKLIVGISLYCAFVLFLFPHVARWFFKRYDDSVLQYIFVLALVFSASFLAEVAGLEAILGAFLAGVVLTRFIPSISPLMNRIEFVGNALFIPYFLIGVGMLIDVRAMFSSTATLWVALNMSVVATVSKWVAAWLTQKTFRLSKTERKMIFGLSNGQAAATLAAVLIGYNLGLFDETVLNGTIVMILVTCTISSIVTERAARQLASEMKNTMKPHKNSKGEDRMLIPVANLATIDGLINIALMLRSTRHATTLHALYVVDDTKPDNKQRFYATEALNKAKQVAAAADVDIETISRYDLNIASGIVHTMKERHISEVVIGMHAKANIIDSFFGDKTMSLINSTNKMIFITRCFTPVSTATRIIIAVPEKAEFESGFPRWIGRIANMAKQIGCRAIFYAHPDTIEPIKSVLVERGAGIRGEYKELGEASQLAQIGKELKPDDLFVVISARRTSMSYSIETEKLPKVISSHFANNNLIVIYPEQFEDDDITSTFSDPLAQEIHQKHISFKWTRKLIDNI